LTVHLGEQRQPPAAQHLVVQDVAVERILVGPVATGRDIQQVPAVVLDAVEQPHDLFDRRAEGVRRNGVGSRGERHAHEVPGGGVEAWRQRAEAHVGRAVGVEAIVGRDLAFGPLQIAQSLEGAHQPCRDHGVVCEQPRNARHDRIAGEHRRVVGHRAA
jgi:hypothetical protein